MEPRLAVIKCQDVAHALRLQEIARGQGLRSTYFPRGGTDASHDDPIEHIFGLLGEPGKINDFVRNYGR